MTCDEATGRYLAGDTGADVTDHIDRCSTCAPARASLDDARAVLADPTTWEEPGDGLEDRVVGLVTGTGHDTPAPARSGWLLGAAVGAAAVIVVVALVALLRPEAPDWEVAMPGTDASPTATSTVEGWNTDVGTRMRLTVTGLGPAPDGHVYELWLSRGGDHVSAGTFTGDGDVAMTVGVRRSDYPRLWVTVEALGGGPGPSGETVLDTGA